MDDYEDRRDFSQAERDQMAKSSAAMADGSFPIMSCDDVDNAVRALGRADPSKRDAVKAHIRKRAASLSCKLPDS